MPTGSPLRQPEHPLAWFDTPQGKAVLADEQGLLMPLLVRCPGNRACHVLPTAQAVALAPTMIMPISTRLWCDDDGWHAGAGVAQVTPTISPHSIELVVAMHVIATLSDPHAKLAALHRMLAPGGKAFFVEFNPWSVYRRHWRGHGMGTMPLRRLCALASECGFEIEATYALRPRTSSESSGMLLRHGWRLPTWLPFRAYAVRASKREPGMTLVGNPVAGPLMGAPNA